MTPTLAHTKMAVHRFSNQPPSITQTSRSPRRQVLLPTQTSTHQVCTGSLAIVAPLKKKRKEVTQKRRPERCSCMVLQRIIGYLPVKCSSSFLFVGYPTCSRNGPLIFSRAPQLKPLAQVKGHTFHLAQRGFEDRLGKVMGFPQGAIS